MSGLRGLEHYGRGERGHGEERKAELRVQRPQARTPVQHRLQRGAETLAAQRRAGPSARRRHRGGLAGAHRRRAGHRQVHPQSPDSAVLPGAQDPLRHWRGKRQAGETQGQPPRRGKRRLPDLQRDPDGEHSRRGPQDNARPDGGGLGTDHVLAICGILPGLRFPDQGMRGDATASGKGDGHTGDTHRAYYQRRQHSRSEDTRAHSGRGPAVRRRQPRHLPSAAQHKEPFRLHLGTGSVRNDRQRPARGQQPVRNADPYARRRTERRRGKRHHRRYPAFPARSTGPGKLRCLRYAATLRDRFRRAQAEHAPGRAGKEGRLQAEHERRIPQYGRRPQGERTGLRPGRRLRGAEFQLRLCDRPGYMLCGRSRPQRRDKAGRPDGKTHRRSGPTGFQKDIYILIRRKRQCA